MDRNPGQDSEERADAAGSAAPQAAEWEVVDDTPPDVIEGGATLRDEPADARMDAVKVRKLSAERRGAYRLRSYCVIGCAFCVVLGIQLAAMAAGGIRERGVGARQLGLACGAVAAGMAASFLCRRALDLTRELRRPPQDRPQAPPDFSTLSDGSHHWKNLDEMQRGT
jgi:hypothetical protein